MYTLPKKKKDWVERLDRKEWSQQQYQREAIKQGFLRIKHWAIPNIIDGYAYMTGNGFSGTNTKLTFVRRNEDVRELDKDLQGIDKGIGKRSENRLSSFSGASKTFFGDANDYIDYSKKHDTILSSPMTPSKYSFRTNQGAIGLYEPLHKEDSVKKLYRLMCEGRLPGHRGRIHLSKFLKGKKCSNYYFDNCNIPYKVLGQEFDTGIENDRIIVIPVQTKEQADSLLEKRRLCLEIVKMSPRVKRFRKRIETKLIRKDRIKSYKTFNLCKSEYNKYLSDRVDKYMDKTWKINNKWYPKDLPCFDDLPQISINNLNYTMEREKWLEGVLEKELIDREHSYDRYQIYHRLIKEVEALKRSKEGYMENTPTGSGIEDLKKGFQSYIESQKINKNIPKFSVSIPQPKVNKGKNIQSADVLAAMGTFIEEYQKGVQNSPRTVIRVSEPYNQSARKVLGCKYNSNDYVRFNEFDFEVTDKALFTLDEEKIPYTTVRRVEEWNQ